ncbi:MAG: hypothetical protein IH899_07370, partial [Planctomycetes bacterium]|nr:hypothetical protein [Planctomycetota bacterium]
GAVIRPRYLDGQEKSIQTRSGPQWDAERGVYRLWLISPDCYESPDGLHWTPTKTRPTMAGTSAVIDPDDPDPQRRYKGLVSRGRTREPVVSPDGLAWKKLDVPPIPSQDESNLSYDEVTRTFIATLKHRGPYGRTVWLSTSKNFENWTKPELIFHPDARDQELAKDVIARRISNPSLQKMFHNDPKVYNVQIYNMGVFRYEGLYIGLPAMFHSTGNVPNYPNTDGFHIIQLTCSRDLRNWTRLGDRAAFIGPSPVGGGAFDLTQILPPSRPVVRGDELLFYYTGLKYRGTFNYVGKYPNGKMVPKTGLDPAMGAICLAVLRRDGFVSLDAQEKPGYVLTSAFTRPAGRLYVNADVKQGGRLQIELLNKDDQVLAKSKPLEGNQLRGRVEWPALADEALVGKTVRLKFTLTKGSLYSYWFAKSDTVSTRGASNDE